MKKLISFLVIGLLLSVPLVADAMKLGTGNMNLTASFPMAINGWMEDYDGR